MATIRNFSLKSSVGSVLLNSEDFSQTVDAVLMESEDVQEKMMVLQTLLSISSKSEQLLAKLKNSSLNRKLKEQLLLMRSDAQFASNPDHSKVLNLALMLSQILHS